jgi:NitT/TauT family transport system ATP-binding protein
MARIEIENLNMTFGEGAKTVPALHDLSLTVEDGEFTSVVGPSGCGKTTLLRIIAGVVEPVSGAINCDGGTGIGVVPQEHSLLPWKTVIDNVGFGLHIKGHNKQERRELAREYIDLVGLHGFEYRYPYELSGGMKQRVNLARALAIQPDVLLMDEPFASLDYQTREIMQYELLQIWGQTSKTVLFITHQIDEAAYLADRVIVLSGRPGRIKADFRINIPRPRDLAVKRTPDFVEILDRIWTLLESDLRKAHQRTPATTTNEAH